MRSDVLKVKGGDRLHAYWKRRRTVAGAFPGLDFFLFDALLSHQADLDQRGDLLEIGALYGKSAIVLGLHARNDEQVYICDTFGAPVGDPANLDENTESYPGLSREAFESNYIPWVPTPPTVIQELSSGIRQHVPDGALRFAHVDGSHLYDVVCTDISNAQSMLSADGVLVVDDYNQMHTPGVAAAIWAAVANDALIPFCLSEQKMYATWNPGVADRMREQLTNWVRDAGDAVHAGRQLVADHEMLLVVDTGVTLGRATDWIPPALARMARSGRNGRPHLGTLG